MGILDDVTDIFGEVTGFGSNGNPNPHNMDPTVYSELYDKALQGILDVGSGGNNGAMRGKVEGAALSALDNLDNNAAGRKEDFMEDMSRGFSADMQNKARAAGGTGNLASVLTPAGGTYDAEARARSRGLNDLYSKAIDDIGQLGNVQGQFFNQDMDKAKTAANLRMNEMGQRRGIGAQNLENTFNSEQAGRQRRMNTISGIAKSIPGMGNMFGGNKGG